MTPDELDRLRELHEKATPAPWHIAPVEKIIVYGDEETGEEVGACFYRNGRGKKATANRALITEARNALPDLLQHIDRLTQRAERAEARLARINRAHPEAYEQALAGDTQ